MSVLGDKLDKLAVDVDAKLAQLADAVAKLADADGALSAEKARADKAEADLADAKAALEVAQANAVTQEDLDKVDAIDAKLV